MPPPSLRQARLLFRDNGFQVIEPGDVVICAETGEPVPLAELRYWSVDKQEPYRDAEASVRNHTRTCKSDRTR